MAKGKIFIISGPSGSGKTTLYKKLLASRNLKSRLVKSISVTTRGKRPGERQGRDYHFVSLKMFLHKKRSGHFLESQKVYDNYYGTPQKAVKDLLAQGKNVLLCIDVKGAKVVLRRFPKAITIFIKTSSQAVLKKRLASRGSEMKDIVDLRLKVAKQELQESKNYKYVVVNDDLRVSLKRLKQIILANI